MPHAMDAKRLCELVANAVEDGLRSSLGKADVVGPNPAQDSYILQTWRRKEKPL